MKEQQEKTVLLTVDGVDVELKEGLLYRELTQQAFEERGGAEIWDLNLSGRDAAQTADEKALESLIRTQVLSRQTENQPLDPEDQRLIDTSIVRLLEDVGTERLQELGISEADLKCYMEKSYRACQYRKSLNFLPGSLESDLKEQVSEAFARYDSLDQEIYLQKVQMDAIMMYTGEWIDDGWISYPDSQREEIRRRMEEAQELLQAGASFAQLRYIYSEDDSLTENPLLNEGVVKDETASELYRGQIQTDLAEKIFRTPAGEYTDILQTQYGYILVRVEYFAQVEDHDYTVYQQQLEKARARYQTTLMQDLSQEQFETEYERLQAEAEVVVNEELWNTVISDD